MMSRLSSEALGRARRWNLQQSNFGVTIVFRRGAQPCSSSCVAVFKTFKEYILRSGSVKVARTVLPLMTAAAAELSTFESSGEGPHICRCLNLAHLSHFPLCHTSQVLLAVSVRVYSAASWWCQLPKGRCCCH